MVFAPANPTPEDYRAPLPSFIISAVPGAAAKDAEVAGAEGAFRDAQRKAAIAREALADLRGADGGPRPSVKRAAYDRADDTYRAAAASAETAERAYNYSAKARYEFMYGKGEGLGALDSEDFTAQVEPLYGEASRRASEALDSLRVALADRDKLASLLGRIIDVDGGNWGLRNALSAVDAYVAAGLNDEAADAWEIVNDALSASLALTATKMEVVGACSAIRDNPDIPVSEKADAYRAVLRKHKMGARRVIR